MAPSHSNEGVREAKSQCVQVSDATKSWRQPMNGWQMERDWVTFIIMKFISHFIIDIGNVTK